MSGHLNLADYTIAWIAPLPFEVTAALYMLDEHHGFPRRVPGQTLQYHLGRVGSHNVAVVGFPSGEVGIGVAGAIAAEITRDMPNLEAGILVGIGAGIPSPEHDIRLGDVVIAEPVGDSAGVVGYDMIKVEPEEIKTKQWQNATHPLLRSVISGIKARSGIFEDGFTRHLSRFHKRGAVSFRLPKPPPPTQFSTKQERRPDNAPVAHYGTILSGNRVVKSEAHRDDLRETYNAMAIEMEAAGMMNRLPVAVIRGISDFADSGKNDEWQLYAAGTAAAYARELLQQLSPLEREERVVVRSQITPGSRISMASLSALLDTRSRNNHQILDWRNSIVDLLKLLGLDHTLGARRRMARRWKVMVADDGQPARNIALHGLVINELLENNGQVSHSIVQALSEDEP